MHFQKITLAMTAVAATLSLACTGSHDASANAPKPDLQAAALPVSSSSSTPATSASVGSTAPAGSATGSNVSLATGAKTDTEVVARAPIAVQHPTQNPGNLDSAVCHVDVWVGVVTDQRIRLRNHQRREVGVQIEHRDDGHIRSDDRPDPAKDVSVRVAVSVVLGTEFDGGERDHERYRSRVITRILTQFEDLPQEDLDYLLDKLGDVLRVAA